VLIGYNGTIFAYGQTGTGKTYTMEGSDDKEEFKGIVPRSIRYIFNAIKAAANTKDYLVRASFLELYNEELIDLLKNPEKKHEKDQ
jgi:kinesin family protein 3/17